MTKYVTVPAELPEGALNDFVLTHSSGEQRGDAWKLLLSQAGAAVEQERSIMQIKDMNGEPVLEMYDNTGRSVTILMSEVANFIAKNAPFASAVLKHSVTAWRNLKINGQGPA